MRTEMSEMKLWTIQPVEVYEILQRDGVFVADETKIDMPEFLGPYKWLCKQLNKKIPCPVGVTIPIWAWYQFCGKQKKPDLRYSCYAARGTQCVCIELDVPDTEVLLSDFELWHWPLNNWWLDNSTCEEEYDKNHEWFDTLSEEEKQKEREKSWQEIFKLDYVETDWMRRGWEIQAVFWQLKKEYVKKVQFFTAR